MMEYRELLREQIDYYRARASEYDDWFFRRDRYDRGSQHRAQWQVEVNEVRSALEQAGPRQSVLELACGTGNWSTLLARHATRLEVIDASRETLEICRQKIEREADLTGEVRYHCCDLFAWQPEAHYDFVFFGFWLSHVPPDLFDEFWGKVRRALAPGGTVFLVDSAMHSGYPRADVTSRAEDSWRMIRDLKDGREYEIVKIYYDPRALDERLRSLGWDSRMRKTETYFLYGTAR